MTGIKLKGKYRWASIKDDIQMITEILFDPKMSWFVKRICIKAVLKTAK